MDVIKKKAKILKALSHPIRMCIVKGLLIEEGCNVSTMQDCLDIPQSTLSQHLIKLKDLGILEGKRNGLNINYYVVNADARKVINTLFAKN
ncbi:MAG: ArsR/SmtB family transcription factor [Halothermotrichaceae bacterium]